MRPLFILSLPRSGSTLLQRMLSAHTQVASVAEPWILLSLASMTGEFTGRTYSDYSTRLARKATLEMVSELPGGLDRYHERLRMFVAGLYEDLCMQGETYFLDKTPRYYLIIDFLTRLFPEAKMIFLLRHPLDVLSSVVTTFSRGRFASHHAHVDLFEGPIRLHEACQSYADRALTVHYEDLVSAPEHSCMKLVEYLGLEYEAAMVTGQQHVWFRGSMGDKAGPKKYEALDTGSVSRWKHVLAPVVRRRFARRYVETLGREVLSTFGVDIETVREEIREVRPNWRGAASDSFWLTSSWLARRGAFNVLRDQIRSRNTTVHKLD